MTLNISGVKLSALQKKNWADYI